MHFSPGTDKCCRKHRITLKAGLPPKAVGPQGSPVPQTYPQGGTGALNPDRRISHRFALQLPITLVLPDTGLKVSGKTRDISSNGIFFYANLPIVEHQEVELLMTLPYEFAIAPVRVACRARVVRVEKDEFSGQKGMAAAIQRFDFLEAIQTAGQPRKQFISQV